MRDMNEDTWFKLDGSPKVTGMVGGRRPGEPIADFGLCFHVWQGAQGGCAVCCWKRSMAGLWCMMKNQYVEGRARGHTAQETEEAYADDCVCFLGHEDPEKLLAGVRFTSEEVCKAAERHGLKDNFGVTKTEALLVLRGSGKNKVKHGTQRNNPTIQVACQELRIVEQCKHMGSMCKPSGAMGPEVSWRVDRTWVAYFAIARHFFGAATISLKCKKSATRLLYSSETWPRLSMGRLEGVQMRWIRKAVRKHRGEGCRETDAQIRAEFSTSLLCYVHCCRNQGSAVQDIDDAAPGW